MYIYIYIYIHTQYVCIYLHMHMHTHTYIYYIYNMYIIYMYNTCDVSHSCHVATYILNRQVPIAGCTTRLAPVRHGRFHSSTLEVPELGDFT